MIISGIQKCTTLDFPQHLSCIVFTPGCNMRCHFCHNPEFVLPQKIREIKNSFIPEQIFFTFLESRKNLLEGVVITGGEPTLMVDLLDFISKIKKMGFKVKLDSNGLRPDIFKKIIEDNLVDYIAMDVKASLEQYKKLTGSRVDVNKIKESIDLLKSQKNVLYEFRTTMIKDIHTQKEMLAIADLIQGGSQLHLQTFRPGNTLNPLFATYVGYRAEEMNQFAQLMRPFVSHVSIRI